MDPRERSNDRQESLRSILDGRQAGLWTALPGFILAYDATKMTCNVQTTIQMAYTDRTGTKTPVTVAPLLDCPVVFPSGGGYTLTFPLAENDECLVVFSSRCIDAWWQQGGVQPQSEFRMHDLSDGFVIPGPFNQTRVLSNISTTTVQLRSSDGNEYVEVDQPNGYVNVSTSKGAKVTTQDGSCYVKVDSDDGYVTVCAPSGLHVIGNITLTGRIICKDDVGGSSLPVTIAGPSDVLVIN